MSANGGKAGRLTSEAAALRILGQATAGSRAALLAGDNSSSSCRTPAVGLRGVARCAARFLRYCFRVAIVLAQPMSASDGVGD
jgi:hypothetical protein